MTYISWFSDVALYLEGYLMYKHDTLGKRVSITMLHLKIMYDLMLDIRNKSGSL